MAGEKQYDTYTEWTFEAGLKRVVGTSGNRTRYQFGVYHVYMIRGGLYSEASESQFEWYRDNNQFVYYRLKHFA